MSDKDIEESVAGIARFVKKMDTDELLSYAYEFISSNACIDGGDYPSTCGECHGKTHPDGTGHKEDCKLIAWLNSSHVKSAMAAKYPIPVECPRCKSPIRERRTSTIEFTCRLELHKMQDGSYKPGNEGIAHCKEVIYASLINEVKNWDFLPTEHQRPNDDYYGCDSVRGLSSQCTCNYGVVEAWLKKT